MSDGTAIEWTDATWNVITGCSVISPGCTNCYAMKLAGTRLKNTPSRKGLTIETKAGPVWNGEVRFNESMLDQPLHWRRPRRIFVCAHADLFHESVPDEWIDRVFAVMALAPQHTFQVLTKRPERARDYLHPRRAAPVALAAFDATLHAISRNPKSNVGKGLIVTGDIAHLKVWPLPNVWLGVSVEGPDQTRRIVELLQCPAAVRWVSLEPLLGPIDLEPWLPWPDDAPEVDGKSWGCQQCDGDQFCPCPVPRAVYRTDEGPRDEHGIPLWVGADRQLLDWVVVGGESGPGARPMHPDWARSLRDQCAAAGVPFFMKQMSGPKGRDRRGAFGLPKAKDKPTRRRPRKAKKKDV